MRGPSSRGSSFYFLNSHPLLPTCLPIPLQKTDLAGMDRQQLNRPPTHPLSPARSSQAGWQQLCQEAGPTFGNSEESPWRVVTGVACPRPRIGTPSLITPRLGLITCGNNSGNHPGKSRMRGPLTSTKQPWGPCVPTPSPSSLLRVERGRKPCILSGPHPLKDVWWPQGLIPPSTLLCGDYDEQMFLMKGPDQGSGGNRPAVELWLPWRGRSPQTSESTSRPVNGTHTLLNSQLLSGNYQVSPWLSPSRCPPRFHSNRLPIVQSLSPVLPAPSSPPPSASHLSGWEPGLEFIGPGCFSQGRFAFVIPLR